MKQPYVALTALVAVFSLMAATAESAPVNRLNRNGVMSVSLRLSQLNHSGQSGTAVLEQEGPWPAVFVTLKMAGIRRGVAESTQIVRGSCANIPSAPQYTLTNATDGTTTTRMEDMQIGSLLDGKHAVVVGSAKNRAVHFACGNLK